MIRKCLMFADICSNSSWALIVLIIYLLHLSVYLSVCFLHSGRVDVCLNEYHVFMLLAGAFMGYSHSLIGVVHNIHYISFHIIQVCVFIYLF